MTCIDDPLAAQIFKRTGHIRGQLIKLFIEHWRGGEDVGEDDSVDEFWATVVKPVLRHKPDDLLRALDAHDTDDLQGCALIALQLTLSHCMEAERLTVQSGPVSAFQSAFDASYWFGVLKGRNWGLAEESRERLLDSKQRAIDAAEARHAPNRARQEQAMSFYAEHRGEYKSDAAIAKVIAATWFREVDTVLGWIAAFKQAQRANRGSA